jgi:hypothetical protein
LVGSKVLSILHLDAGFQLGEVEEAASIDRHVVDLLAAEYALHCGLFRVDGDGEACTSTVVVSWPTSSFTLPEDVTVIWTGNSQLLRLEAFSLHANLVIADRQAARVVGTAPTMS